MGVGLGFWGAMVLWDWGPWGARGSWRGKSNPRIRDQGLHTSPQVSWPGVPPFPWADPTVLPSPSLRTPPHATSVSPLCPLCVPQCPHCFLWPLPSMALLALTLALLAMTVATMAIKVKPLDMAPDAFDDQYQNCSRAMMEELPALKRSELQNNSLFAKVWLKATHLWKFWGSPQYPLSSSDHAFALMAYTMDDLSEQFDDEVSVSGHSSQEYRDNFEYKALHFLLTDAVAALRDAQGQKCHCVAWGVDDYKFRANVGDIVRFGQFSLSTLCENIFHHFRTTTVFKVQTCHGADIREFSRYPNVKGLLIPPFEKFNVTEVVEKRTSVEIHLDSIGTYSKYNCEWLTGGSVPTTPTISENSSWPPQLSQ